MSNNLYAVLILLTISMALVPLHAAQADDDHVEARRLLDSGEILPLEVILNGLRQRFPGRILDVELETEDGRILYEVEILDADGIVTEVYINARNGKVLSAKEDD
ncbi:MAG: PepSY domain-containing protein [Thiogranum sp.]